MVYGQRDLLQSVTSRARNTLTANLYRSTRLRFRANDPFNVSARRGGRVGFPKVKISATRAFPRRTPLRCSWKKISDTAISCRAILRRARFSRSSKAAASAANQVYLDLTHIPAETLTRKLGVASTKCSSATTRATMRIFSGVHYSMGGRVDYEQRTNIPGLSRRANAIIRFTVRNKSRC